MFILIEFLKVKMKMDIKIKINALLIKLLLSINLLDNFKDKVIKKINAIKAYPPYRNAG